MVSAGFKTIRVDLHRFCLVLMTFFVDVGRFYMISTIWHIDRIDLGIFGELDLVNLIGLFDFLWIRAVWVDLGGFQSIRMDLCRLGMT